MCINSSQQVIDVIKNISVARSFDSYDFSTLYTNIAHDSLKSSLKNLIEVAYKVRGALYIHYNKSGNCIWSRVKGTS